MFAIRASDSTSKASPSPESEACHEESHSSSKSCTCSAVQEISTTLMCPIGWLPFRDPVICPDGQTYEREAISQWFENSNKERFNEFGHSHPHGMATSPVTRQPMYIGSLIPNITVKNMVAPWNQVQSLLAEKDARIEQLEKQLEAFSDKPEVAPSTSWKIKHDALLREVKHSVSAFRRKKIHRKDLLNKLHSL